MIIDTDMINDMSCVYIKVFECFCIVGHGIGSLLGKSRGHVLRWIYDSCWCKGLFWCSGFAKGVWEEEVGFLRLFSRFNRLNAFIGDQCYRK